jgi:hypothetical protein
VRTAGIATRANANATRLVDAHATQANVVAPRRPTENAFQDTGDVDFQAESLQSLKGSLILQ